MPGRKKVGFLTFAHWGIHPDGSRDPVKTIQDLITLATEAELLGLDGVWLRVHHFQPMLSSALPVLAAIGAVTKRIELGTAVIDMRYALPAALAEDSATVDALVPGRLNLGLSRGAPEPFDNGPTSYGFGEICGEVPSSEPEWTRATQLRDLLDGKYPTPQEPHSTNSNIRFRIEPTSPQLADRLWWGSGGTKSAIRAAQNGFGLLSSTLLLQDDGSSFSDQQASQIVSYRAAWAAARHRSLPQAAVTRLVHVIEDQEDEDYFGALRADQEKHSNSEGKKAVQCAPYVGSIDEVIELLHSDRAISEADWVLFTLPEFTSVAYTSKVFKRWVRIQDRMGWT